MSSPACFFVNQQFLPQDHSRFRNTHDYEYHQLPPQSAASFGSPYQYSEEAIISDALALLHQPANLCMNSDQYLANSIPHSTPFGYEARHEYSSPESTTSSHQWMYPSSMGVPAIQHSQGLKRSRSHQRTPSASTVGSNGPASPFQQNWGQPFVANADFSPNSPSHFTAQAGAFPKNPYLEHTPIESDLPFGYMPNQPVSVATQHQAMRGFAIDHHIAEDFAPVFQYAPRQTMSIHSNDSPVTPPLETIQNGQHSAPSSDYRPQPNPNIQLFRTESAAYQDELYNPPITTFAPTPSSATMAATNLLTPHRNLVTERLNTANNARSHSPVSGVSRERSPFRDGSPLAPPAGWRSPINAPGVGTAAGMRQQQKEQADEAELAQHRPQLRREPTKTISPKDALLDYNEQEQPSLFQDSIPAGYKQHNGATGQWSNNNNFVSQPGAAFGSLTNPGQQLFTSFRAGSAEGFPAPDAMAFAPLPPNEDGQGRVQSNMMFPNSFAAPKMGAHLDANPEFPAHLTSMESSASDHGPPPSSQDSSAATLLPQKPADTRAGTGTYTCTYHGCTKRFDSHSNLQKHKRDMHRSQSQPQQDNTNGGTSSGSGSESPRSSQSPAPVDSSDMTNAAIMARNSQAGPHKCSRINPSTNKPCNTVFSRPYDLTRHEDTIHNNRAMKVRCPMCREEKTFSRNDALTRHMRVVHPEVETFGKRGKRGD